MHESGARPGFVTGGKGTNVKQQESRFRVSDGCELQLYQWLPDAPSRGVIQIAHGMAEHGARYRRVAERLTDAGWEVWASDHRGHGLTAPSPEALGFVSEQGGWDRMVEDLKAIGDEIRAKYPRVPSILLGHSMGSFLTQTLMLRYPSMYDGFILSGSTAGGAPELPLAIGVARLERLRIGPKARSEVLRRLIFGLYNIYFEHRTPNDWLSRDHAEVDAYGADPLCGVPNSTQLWLDSLGALARLGRADWRVVPSDCPIYVFAGTSDPVGDFGRRVRKLVRSMRAAGLRNVTEKLYEKARHETFNETNRDEVIDDVVRWLDAQPWRAEPR